jgi:hypothetical protein
VALVVALLAGCAADNKAEVAQASVPVTVVWQSAHCNVDTASLRRIETQAEWQDIAAQAVNQMGGQPSKAMPLDFTQYTYSLVALGSRPNPGYGLEITADKALYRHGVLTLPVRETKPDPDKMYAQVLVSPCMVLATPVAGNVTDIKMQ